LPVSEKAFYLMQKLQMWMFMAFMEHIYKRKQVNTLSGVFLFCLFFFTLHCKFSLIISLYELFVFFFSVELNGFTGNSVTWEHSS